MKTTADIADMINERRKKKNLPEVNHMWVYHSWVKLLSEELPAAPRPYQRSKLYWDDSAANKMVSRLWRQPYRGINPKVSKAADYYHKLIYG